MTASFWDQSFNFSKIGAENFGIGLGVLDNVDFEKQYCFCCSPNLEQHIRIFKNLYLSLNVKEGCPTTIYTVAVDVAKPVGEAWNTCRKRFLSWRDPEKTFALKNKQNEYCGFSQEKVPYFTRTTQENTITFTQNNRSTVISYSALHGAPNSTWNN